MPNTYRTVTQTLDATGVIRYLRHASFAENAGTPAEARVLLRDGNGGPIVVDIRIPASESRHLSWSPPLFFSSGCYVEVSSGVNSVRGSVDGE